MQPPRTLTPVLLISIYATDTYPGCPVPLMAPPCTANIIPLFNSDYRWPAERAAASEPHHQHKGGQGRRRAPDFRRLTLHRGEEGEICEIGPGESLGVRR